MTILTANLKHLYQRRGVWLWYLFIWLQIPVYIVMGIKADRYLGYLLISFFMGLIVASIQKEILSKPFSFCLPAHGEIPRRLFLWVGIVLNGVLGFLFMFYPGIEFPSVFLAVLAGGVVGMIVYLLCAFSTLLLSVEGYTWPPLVIILYYGVVFKKWDVALQEVIVSSPFVVIGLGGFLCWFVWRRIDVGVVRRETCGKISMTLFDGYNKEKVERYKLARLAEKDKKKPNSLKVSSRVEEFFVSRIRGAESGSLGQYIWGSLYKSFGMAISQQRQEWMRFLIITFPVLCLLCYLPGNMKNLIFVWPAVMVFHVSLWVHSGLSVSGGRRERFWSALTLASATGLLATAAAAFLAVGTHLVVNIMPPLMIKGHEFTFSALDMVFLLVPLAMIPVTFTISLICHKKPMIKFILFIVLFQILFAMSIVSNLTIFNWRVQPGLEHLIILLLCTWALFISVLRYISMRCCLVSQTR